MALRVGHFYFNFRVFRSSVSHPGVLTLVKYEESWLHLTRRADPGVHFSLFQRNPRCT